MFHKTQATPDHIPRHVVSHWRTHESMENAGICSGRRTHTQRYGDAADGDEHTGARSKTPRENTLMDTNRQGHTYRVKYSNRYKHEGTNWDAYSERGTMNAP